MTPVLWFIAIFFFGMGVYGLAAPAQLIKPFGIELRTPEARSEVRAVYGGFGVAIGAVLIAAAISDTPAWRDGVTVTVAVALAGMAFGRLVARTVERPSAFYPIWFYFWVEAIAAGLLFTTAALN